MRANSIFNPGVAASRELPSNFDKIEAIASIVSEIEELAPYTSEIAEIVANLPDVVTVQEANDLINNLSVSVVGTLPAGSEAVATLNGTTIELQLPVGATGEAGINGFTPELTFSYNPATGWLEYDVTYKDYSGIVVDLEKEW